MKSLIRYAVAAAAVFVLPGIAQAAPIVTNQWYEFQFGGVGSALFDCTTCTPGINPASIYAPAAPWTFNSVGSVALTVVDGFQAGDRFELFDNLVSLGLTSVPGTGSCNDDITACLADSDQSQGVFLLGAGAHSLTGIAAASPFGGGASFFRVTEVPEPLTLSLFGAGFAGAVAMRRRRKSN